MPVKTEIQVIDGLETATTQFPALASMAILPRVMQFSLGLGSDGGDVMKSLATMPSKDMESFIQDILRGTQVTLRPDNAAPRVVQLSTREDINAVYSGRLPTLFKTVAWVIQVNFADFGGGTSANADASAPTPTANG